MLPPFYRLTALDEAASTNDEALALAAGGAPEGTLVTARRQSAGRGRRGRTWASLDGNLHLSLVLTPPGGAVAAPAMGFAAALAAARAMEGFLPAGADIALKWPNDVLLGGAKAAGLLIEAVPGREGAFVLGLGINVVAHPLDTPYPATDMRAHGARAAAEEVLAAFGAAFLARYDDFRQNGFAPLRHAWLARARGLGAAVTVVIEGARHDGIFRALNEDGALVLDLGGGTVKTITAGDVFFAGA